MSLNGRDVRLSRESTSRRYTSLFFVDRRVRVTAPQTASATPTPAAITSPITRAVPSGFVAVGCGRGGVAEVAGRWSGRAYQGVSVGPAVMFPDDRGKRERELLRIWVRSSVLAAINQCADACLRPKVWVLIARRVLVPVKRDRHVDWWPQTQRQYVAKQVEKCLLAVRERPAQWIAMSPLALVGGT